MGYDYILDIARDLLDRALLQLLWSGGQRLTRYIARRWAFRIATTTSGRSRARARSAAGRRWG